MANSRNLSPAVSVQCSLRSLRRRKFLVEDINADPKANAEIEELMAKIYGGELPKGHMENFFDCVRSGRQPVANVHDHVRSVNACHLANIALLTGRTVKFDPKAQQFPDDAEANRLIGRPSRPSYTING